MQIHPDSSDYKFTIVVGCGRLGSKIANDLSEQGANVVIIDRDEQSFRKLSPAFGGLAISGDASDFDVLRKAEIEKADVLLAVSDNDNSNILIGEMAHYIFGVKRVIIRLLDPDRTVIYQDSDIDTICPASLSLKEINSLLLKPVNQLVLHQYE